MEEPLRVLNGSISSGTKNLQHLHIAAKQMVPIMIAAVIWGRKWRGCRVTTLCDNSASNCCYSEQPQRAGQNAYANAAMSLLC